MDVAARIASGFAYSEMRLQDLVEAYSTQLRGLLHGSPFQEYQRFNDTNSRTVYKAIHALFWEMAVLRDMLAEFAATFCFLRSNITTFAWLANSLRKEPSHDHLAVQILEAADEGKNGWLSVFSFYRNLFTHSAPMERVAGLAFAVQDTRRIATNQTIPQIYYPLPANAAELSRRRSKGQLFKTFQELIDSSSRNPHERHSEPDALDYLSNFLKQLAQLSELLIVRSPIPPQSIEIPESDIIGEIKVSSM
jgi:hypothetical protein